MASRDDNGKEFFFYFFMSRYAHLLLQSVGKGLNFGTDKVN